MKTETLHIDGMTCNHCVMSVRRELARIDHLDVEDVRIGSAVVRFEEGQIDAAALDDAVSKAGFTVTRHE